MGKSRVKNISSFSYSSEISYIKERKEGRTERNVQSKGTHIYQSRNS